MNIRAVQGFIIVLLCVFCGQRLEAAYLPLGANQISGFTKWDTLRESSATPTADGRRPVLLGVNGRNLELLQDGIARKWNKKVPNGSLSAARVEVSKITPFRLPAIRGYMAEAIYLDNHPDWKYVGKTNATQHDVWAKMPNGGRGLQTGQVKFHMSGNAAMYARDMLKDYRSGSFFVPDDHADQLRTHLKSQADRLRVAGDNAGADVRYRDINRVKGLAATSTQIDKATRQAISEAQVVRVAPYVFLGVASTFLVAPAAWDYYTGAIDENEAVYRLAKGGSSILAGIAVDQSLKQLKGGLLRGSMRGNLVTACAVLLTDTSWQVYETGGVGTALHNPEFIINLGGNVSATALGLAGGYVGAKTGAAIGSCFGPKGALAGGMGGGLVVGSAAGFAGYVGGSKGTKWAMETFTPEKLYIQERAYVNEVSKDIEKSISELQTM